MDFQCGFNNTDMVKIHIDIFTIHIDIVTIHIDVVATNACGLKIAD